VIAKDKQLHFIAGLAIALVAGSLVAPLAGLIAAVIVGAAKEIRDMMGYGTPEWLDFLYTVAGGLLGYSLSLYL